MPTGKLTRATGSCPLKRKNDLKDGQGQYFYLSGARFSGSWANNVKHGEGTTVYEDLTEYQCNYVNGVRHGKALVTSPDGKRMAEEYENGKLVQRQLLNPDKQKKSDEEGSGSNQDGSGSRSSAGALSNKSFEKFKDGCQRFMNNSTLSTIPQDWSLEQVVDFLRYIGLEDYTEEFQKENIDGQRLMNMSEDDMNEIGILAKGHRMTMRENILKLQKLAHVYKHRVNKMKDAVICPFSPGRASNKSIENRMYTYHSMVDTIEEVEEDGTSITNRSIVNSMRLSWRSFSKSPAKRISWLKRATLDGGFFFKDNDLWCTKKVRALSAIESEVIREFGPIKAYDDLSKHLSSAGATNGFQIEDIDRFNPENENFPDEQQERISHVAQPSCSSNVVIFDSRIAVQAALITPLKTPYRLKTLPSTSSTWTSKKSSSAIR